MSSNIRECPANYLFSFNSISRQFIDQDADTAINFTLQAIAEFMGAEQSRIFEYLESNKQFYKVQLTSLMGSLDLLSTGQLGTLSAKGQQVLNIVTTNTERLIRLINDILDLERMKSGKIPMQPVKCNVADLLNQAVAAMQAMAERSQITLVT